MSLLNCGFKLFIALLFDLFIEKSLYFYFYVRIGLGYIVICHNLGLKLVHVKYIDLELILFIMLRSAPVKEQLKTTIRQVLHENTEVRLLGLKRLCKELSLYRQEIASFIFENDTMDSFIIEVNLQLLIYSIT